MSLTDDDLGHATQLRTLVRSDARLMGLLRAVRALGLSEWCIAAGAIRNRVWDHLHGHSEPTLPSDIDVLFYDRTRTDSAYETEIERRLIIAIRSVRWEAVNQATVHCYTKDTPYDSIEAAMARWADPVTAVGVHLTDADELRVIAPHGLQDLFGLGVRPNLAAPNAMAIYRERIATKQWTKRWPKLTIFAPEDTGM